MPGKEIYDEHADQYEELVSREDYTHNLAPALNQIRPLAGLDVVELGAGTGRLTCLIAPQVRSVLAFDVSAPMLQVAKAKLERSGSHPWRVAVADHRELPIGDASADLVLAGWTIAQMVAWNLETWQAQVESVLAEMRRVLRPAGALLFSEHGRAPDEGVARWQDRLNPIWRRLSGGCNINRAIPDVLGAAGFTLAELDSMYLPGPRLLTFTYWGMATRT